MTKYVIDSSAWIEYFKGTPEGQNVKKYFEANELFTTSLCVAEITAKFLREGLPVEAALLAIRSQSTIISLDFPIGSEAGKLYFELRKKKPKIALSDAFSLIVAKNINAKVLTFDNDFRGSPEAIVL